MFGRLFNGLCVALVFAQGEILAAECGADLLDRLLAVEQMHAGLCNSALDTEFSRKRIADMVEEARARLSSASVPAESAVQALNGIVFGPAGIRSSPDLRDPCNLLISGVLARGQGYCVGVAGVYLSVAERLGLPVYAVGTPTHVFLRYDDGSTQINVETNGGATLTDAQYLERQRIAPEAVRKGVFLQNMSPEHFLAQVHNNLGVIYSERGDFESARVEYETALRLDRRLPAAWYNLAKDLQARGRLKEAVRAFSKALRLYTSDTWALNNRGLVYRQLQDSRRARLDFEAALRIDPGFEQARLNLATLTSDEPGE